MPSFLEVLAEFMAFQEKRLSSLINLSFKEALEWA